MNTLQELSNALRDATRAASGFVVAVNTGGRFGASGVVWQPGVAVTTHSSMRRAEDLQLTLPDGSIVAATVAGRDPGTDLAVLRFEEASAVRSTFEESPEPGQIALAVGRAENTGPNVAAGVVSAVGQPWQTWQGGRLSAYIRLDVALHAGSSGAAVVSASGGLIGIATPALSRIAPLAIPSNTVERVVQELLSKGSVARPWLGVAVQPVPLPKTLAEAAQSGAQGLIVLSADPETPAGRAGVLVGDILVRLGDAGVSDPIDLQTALGLHSAGEQVELVLLRGGERKQLTATLGERARS
jgi:S1-C subfamily serine protease